MPQPSPVFTQPSQVTQEVIRINAVTGEQVSYSVTYPTVDHKLRNFFRSYTGTKTPDYFTKRKLKRSLPLNPYSMRVVRVQNASTFYSSTLNLVTGFQDVIIQSDCRMWHPFTPSEYGWDVSTEARLKAMNRLHSKLSGVRSNLALMFAERREIARLLSGNLARVARAARWLKRGNLPKFFKELKIKRSPTPSEVKRVTSTPPSKRIADHWLEYTFGWVPLLQDIFGALELFTDEVVNNRYHTEVSASGRHSGMIDVKSLGVTAHRGTLFSMVRKRFVLRFEIESELKVILAQTGISNPALLFWDALPYSFVVDWLIPVNKYLSALSAYDGFVFKEGIEITQSWWNINKDFTFASSDGGFRSSQSGSCNVNEITYSRTLLASFPSASSPVIRNPLDNGPLWKFATSMALLRQLFSR